MAGFVSTIGSRGAGSSRSLSGVGRERLRVAYRGLGVAVTILGVVVTGWVAVWFVSDNYLHSGVTLRSTSGAKTALALGLAIVGVGVALVCLAGWAGRTRRVPVVVVIIAIAVAAALSACARAVYPRSSALVVVAIDPATGQTLWRSTLPATSANSITVSGDRLEVAATVSHRCDYDFVMFELSTRDGARLSTNPGRPSTKPGPYLSGTELGPDPAHVMPTQSTVPGLRLDVTTHRITSDRSWSRHDDALRNDEAPALVTPSAIYLGEQAHPTLYCSR